MKLLVPAEATLRSFGSHRRGSGSHTVWGLEPTWAVQSALAGHTSEAKPANFSTSLRRLWHAEHQDEQGSQEDHEH